jgi:RNA polymerase sigma factor (sigma-70 family)
MGQGMAEAPQTSLSLLARLRDLHDREAWSRFVDAYGPAVFNFARGKGLQPADASDLTQEVMRCVAAGIHRLEFDPNRGKFRSWLFTLVQRRYMDYLRRVRLTGSGDSSVMEQLDQLPDRQGQDSQTFDDSVEKHLLAAAMRQVESEVNPSTFQAFKLTALEGKTGKEVSEKLGLTLAAVYLARSRVTSRLKAIVRELEEPT